MNEEKKISAGLYIGHGPKPDNVDAGMYVDMQGRNVGVYIGMGRPQTLGEILEQAIRDNPEHAAELQQFFREASVTPREQIRPLLTRIVDWGKKNSTTLVGAAQLLYKIASDMLDKM